MNYNKYKNLIYKKAWDFKKKNPHICIDDLISEGNLIFMKCCKTFDENKNVLFSTYLNKCLFYGLYNFIRVENNYHKKTKILKEDIIKYTNFTFFELSDDSKKLIGFINELEKLPINLPTKKNKITKQLLSSIMHNSLGYKYKKINNIFQEIKECLA